MPHTPTSLCRAGCQFGLLAYTASPTAPRSVFGRIVPQYFNRFMELHRLDYFPHLKQKYDALKQQPKPPMRPKPGKMTPEQIEQAKPMGEILEKGELEAHLKEEQEQTQVRMGSLIGGGTSQHGDRVC